MYFAAHVHCIVYTEWVLRFY